MEDVQVAQIGLENIEELIQSNADLIGLTLMEDADKLYENVDALKAFVKDCAESFDDDWKLLMMEISKVVFGAENTIQAFIASASNHKELNEANEGDPQTVVNLAFEVRLEAKDIDKVTEKVHKLKQNKPHLDSGASEIQETFNRWVKKAKSPEALKGEEDAVIGFDNLLGEEGEAVGFDNLLKVIIQGPSRKSDQLQIMSIVGMGGTGKTTLAKMVLNDPQIQLEFYPRAFVTVGEENHTRRLLLRILGAFMQITEEMKRMPRDELIEILRNQLKSRKYLIVLDDVWAPEVWDNLKVGFPYDKQLGSTILVTTRMGDLARSISTNIYKLNPMNDDESQKFLCWKVFGDIRCPLELEEYVPHIVKPCDGNRLLISLVSGILLNHRDKIDWWRKLARMVGGYVLRNHMEVLQLSYNLLHFHLKPCFLYLGVFPGDIDIPVWKLVQLWIAEEFVNPDGVRSLENIAEEYLEDLVDRKLVSVAQRRSNGRIKTCHVHDIVYDFCLFQAHEENLFRGFVGGKPSLDNSPGLRLCSRELNYIGSERSGEYVRTFFYLSYEDEMLLHDNSFFPKAFKLIKVLDVGSIMFSIFPIELCSLVLLTFLAISCDFEILPARMSLLSNLQTLIVETSHHTLEIEANIWKLSRLRHLRTNASTYLRNSEEEHSVNTSILTLSRISPETWKKQGFGRNPNLKKLTVSGKLAPLVEVKGEPSWFDSISELEHLENLKLLNDDPTSKLDALPCEYRFPRMLTSLTLSNTMLDWKYMDTLGKLENLEVLKLKKNAFYGDLWETEDGGFLRLKFLHVGKTNLAVWKSSASHFPALTCLFLRHCSRLEAVPIGLADIPSLEKIDICFSNNSVASSAKKIQSLKQQEQNANERGFKLVCPAD